MVNYRLALVTAAKMGPPSTQSYNPMPSASREGRHPSIRDDVRSTIQQHKFQPSSNRFTDVRDIYRLYLKDTNQIDKDCPQLEDKFRSALGRVLRPPLTAGPYAISYAVPCLTRWNGSLSIISPDARQIDPKEETKNKKLQTGTRCRQHAQASSTVKILRAKRKAKAIREAEHPTPEEPLQHVSFRYMDEFVGLRCAEDLIRLRVRPFLKFSSSSDAVL